VLTTFFLEQLLWGYLVQRLKEFFPFRFTAGGAFPLLALPSIFFLGEAKFSHLT